MGILATILGSGDIISKGLGLIDDIHTSKEEEIVAKTKAKIDLLSAYAPFKVAQRYIAIMFTGVYLLTYVITLGMAIAGIGNPEDISNVMSDYQMGYIQLAIIAFYFGGGAFEGFRNSGTK